SDARTGKAKPRLRLSFCGVRGPSCRATRGSKRFFRSPGKRSAPGDARDKGGPAQIRPAAPGCACCKGTGNIETCFAIRFAAGESLFLARAKRRFPAPNGCLEITKKNANPNPSPSGRAGRCPALPATAEQGPCLASPGRTASTAPPWRRCQVLCNGRNDSNRAGLPGEKEGRSFRFALPGSPASDPQQQRNPLRPPKRASCRSRKKVL